MKRAEIPAPKERMVIKSYDKVPDPPAGGLVVKVREHHYYNDFVLLMHTILAIVFRLFASWPWML